MHPYVGNQDWIPTYGLVLVLALATCWWLGRRNARSVGIDASHIDLLLPLALLAGFGLSALRPEPQVQLIPLIACCLGVVFVYSRASKLSFAQLTDVLAVPTLVAIAIQRVGCFLAGCCWGHPVGGDTWRWLGVEFPAGSFAFEQQLADGLIEPGAMTSHPVHATQLYEAVLLVPLASALWRSARSPQARGAITLTAIAGYAAIRFGVEFLRAEVIDFPGPFTLVQVLCLGLFAMGGLQARRLRLYS